jgi:alpha-tubulin suppressor-like RCC1 family protein
MRLIGFVGGLCTRLGTAGDAPIGLMSRLLAPAGRTARVSADRLTPILPALVALAVSLVAAPAAAQQPTLTTSPNPSLANQPVRLQAVVSDATAPTGTMTFRETGVAAPLGSVAVSTARYTKVAAGGSTMCGIVSDTTLECWGNNVVGQLGDGSNTNVSLPKQVPGLFGVTDVELGNDSVCAVLSDKTVKCWGDNTYGQVGNTTGGQVTTPRTVTGLTDVTKVEVGTQFACALKSDATVVCWGRNFYGQLGNGTTTDTNTPTAVPGLPNVTAITAGYDFACALQSDRTVVCWGRNNLGQLGAGDFADSSSPRSVVNLSTAVNISAGGGYQVCALLTDATAKCWGRNDFGQLGTGTAPGDKATPQTVTGLSNVTNITSGNGWSCAALSSGNPKCWGFNYYGALAQGSSGDLTAHPTPLDTPAYAGAVYFALGGNHGCAILSDDTIKCVGLNTSGQLGNGGTTSHLQEAQVTVTAVVKTFTKSVAIINKAFSAGNHTLNAEFSPTAGPVSLSADVVQTVNQAATTTVLTSSPASPTTFGQLVQLTATVSAAFGTPTGTVTFTNGAGNVIATGNLTLGSLTLLTTELPVGTNTITATYNGTADYAGSASAGLSYTVNKANTTAAISVSPASPGSFGKTVKLTATIASNPNKPTGQVTFTDTVDGLLGTATVNGGVATLLTSSLSVGAHSITADYAANASYNGSTSAALPYTVDKASSATTVASSLNPSSFNQSVTFSAKVFGSTTAPTGNVEFRDGATSLGTVALGAGSGTAAASIVAGASHSCLLTPAGGVKCWGNGALGQIGNGSTADQAAPVDVTGLTSGVTAIVAGANHTCALTTGGGVKCWGFNGNGRLGNGSTSTTTAVVDVVGLGSGVVAISAGGDHTCAVTSAGDAKCWGFGGQGQLGTGNNSNASSPVNVVNFSSDVVSVAAGISFTCALTSGGGVKCWGQNNSGQIGIGVLTVPVLSPVDVNGLTSGVSAIAVGLGHSCAVLSGGGVKCWGGNGSGQLGDGSTTDRLAPVDVGGLAGVAGIAGGDNHTCALTTTGGLKCWGRNDDGELGDGTTTSSSTPVDVVSLDPGVVAFDAGGAHSCAVTNYGAAKCWGNNGSGRLGDGTTTSQARPVDVSGFAGVSASASLSTSALAVGNRSITAAYVGDTNTLGSTSPVLTQVVNKGANTITFPVLADTAFTATPPTPGASASSNQTVTYSTTTAPVCTVTVGGTISFVSAGTCSITASQAGNANFAAATAVTQSFAVTQGANTITFPALANTAFTATPPAPSASASSNLTVTYSTTTAPVCTVTVGGTISFVSAGTCSITASQAGNANFAAATAVTQSFAVTQGANTITFPALANTAFTATPPVPAASASSNLTVAYSTKTAPVCTVTGGGVISFVSAGTCSITASQAGSANFSAATDVTQSFTITPGINTITFPALASTAFSSPAPIPAASASSTLTVTYATTTAPVCTVTAGGTISFVSAGTCSIRASQAGNANFAAATDVTRSFSVTPGVNTITFPALASTAFTSPAPIPAASASSTLTVTYATTTAPVCTVTAGGTISFVSAGTCSIKASQAGNANFAAATDVTRSFSVTPGVNTITFPALANTAFTATPPIPAATTSSNLAVTYASNTAAVCQVTVSGSISFVNAGTCSITASQAGSANFDAAADVTRSFTVTPGVNTITFPALANAAFASAPPVLAATSSSNLPVTYASTTASVCTATGTGAITFVKTGTCTITASQAGNANFAAATTVTRSFSVTPGANTITFPVLANTAFTATPPIPAATASSNLTVTYASTTAPVCTATGAGVITFVKTGTCTIRASQAGNANFAAATTVTRSFNVTPGGNTITFPAMANTAFTAAPPIPAATASSNLTVTYASTTAPVCTATNAGAISFVSAGTCTITASQAGNANFAAATPVTRSFAVTPGVNSITFPALANTAFNATPPVPAATATSNLTVTYASTTAPVCTVTAAGVITFVKAGTCSITASQAGNASFAAATPVSRSFTVLATVTVVTTSSKTSSAYGVPVTFTATVTVPNGGQPTGTVTFKDGDTTIGTGTLSNGVATLTTATLEVGTHSITAAYGGSQTQAAAVSPALTQTVTKALVTATLTVSPTPVPVGNVVTLVATLAATPQPATAATGSIVFKDGQTVIGTGTLLSGSATLTTSTLPPGGHSITANYAGDARYAASTSAAMPLTVERSCSDSFSGTPAFAEAGGSASGSTSTATGEAGEAKHGGDTGTINSVWCKWTAPAAGPVTIDTTARHSTRRSPSIRVPRSVNSLRLRPTTTSTRRPTRAGSISRPRRARRIASRSTVRVTPRAITCSPGNRRRPRRPYTPQCCRRRVLC